MSSKIY